MNSSASFIIRLNVILSPYKIPSFNKWKPRKTQENNEMFRWTSLKTANQQSLVTITYVKLFLPSFYNVCHSFHNVENNNDCSRLHSTPFSSTPKLTLAHKIGEIKWNENIRYLYTYRALQAVTYRWRKLSHTKKASGFNSLKAMQQLALHSW